MPTGLALPLGVDRAGKAQVTSGTAQLQKLLVIALQTNSDSNPFQQLGLPENIIFNLNTPNVKARIDQAIRNIFDGFENQGRARLRRISFEKIKDEGELAVTVSFQDLETTKDADIELILPVQGNIRPRVAVLE